MLLEQRICKRAMALLHSLRYNLVSSTTAGAIFSFLHQLRHSSSLSTGLR